jgi:hypothetical protein
LEEVSRFLKGRVKGDAAVKKSSILLVIVCLVSVIPLPADVKLEPFTYKENFESGNSTPGPPPLWQDTAYDPNLRPGTIVPGDLNISLLQKVTPMPTWTTMRRPENWISPWPGLLISLRYYLKTHLDRNSSRFTHAAGVNTERSASRS